MTTVLVVEDDERVARAIARTLKGLVDVVIAPSFERAVHALETRRDLRAVLADVRLADGSSGIDAVSDILVAFDVPVIFITAYPERLLSGERPEPAYLITKPFLADTVKATIGQALFFHGGARP